MTLQALGQMQHGGRRWAKVMSQMLDEYCIGSSTSSRYLELSAHP